MTWVWQPLPRLANRAPGITGGRAVGRSEDAPVRGDRLAVRCYLIVVMNMRHALAGTFSAGPLRSLVSRAVTVPGVLATSTHSPPSAPE
jgi:hypothetical protein